ncbi:MAG TPA: MBL fold metallo-hydrolase [Gemmatimonadaceae bacterium]|nr:MBL fold metallo-hydrolase [Gemmatimonadaceae bacterium]
MLIPIAGASGAHLVDLEYRGRREYLAALLLESADGLAVIDPGPTTSLETLLHAVRAVAGDERALRHVLLTHIHLDHGGCAGVVAQRFPAATIYVHERGAPHLIDPARLLASATRLYGDRMQELWGEVLACPADRIRIVRDGDCLTIGGRELRVAYTPGHAIHHVAYLDSETGLAYVGDAAGERFHSGTPIIPTTPPPDIDLEAWSESSAKLRAWTPSALVLSHFGVFADAVSHLAEHENVLEAWSAMVRASLDEPGTDDERADRFAAKQMEALRSASTPEGATRVHFSQIRDCWLGLARYWRRGKANLPR